MRPVNLIPPEERRGDKSELRHGPLAYGIVGLLAVVLVVLVAVITLGNQVSEREAQLASIEVREDAASARATALAPYAQFATMSAARDLTVTTLAKSRFDWERVLRELALVIPEDVWLISTTGTISPDQQVEGSTGNPLRAQAPGPALELVGCGDGQESVAEFVAALKDIDGVTRVGLQSSELPLTAIEAPTEGDSGGGDSSDCRTKNFIAKFEIVVAFDAVPVTDPAAATAVPEATPAAAVTPPAAPPADADAAAVEETVAEEDKVRSSTRQQTEAAGEAAEIVPEVGK